MKTKEMQDGTHKRNQEDEWEAEILDILDETMDEAEPIPQRLFERMKHIRELAEINKKRDLQTFLLNQKDIGAEYEQAILRNLDDLYEE